MLIGSLAIPRRRFQIGIKRVPICVCVYIYICLYTHTEMHVASCKIYGWVQAFLVHQRSSDESSRKLPQRGASFNTSQRQPWIGGSSGAGLRHEKRSFLMLLMLAPAFLLIASDAAQGAAASSPLHFGATLMCEPSLLLCVEHVLFYLSACPASANITCSILCYCEYV